MSIEHGNFFFFFWKKLDLEGGTQKKSKEGPFREDSLIFSVAGTHIPNPTFSL